MNDDVYRWARARVARLRGFYVHAAVFVFVNAILAIVNLLASPQSFWFLWGLLGWGIGLCAHAAIVFGSDSGFAIRWENRKVEEFVNREREREVEQVGGIQPRGEGDSNDAA